MADPKTIMENDKKTHPECTYSTRKQVNVLKMIIINSVV